MESQSEAPLANEKFNNLYNLVSSTIWKLFIYFEKYQKYLENYLNMYFLSLKALELYAFKISFTTTIPAFKVISKYETPFST